MRNSRQIRTFAFLFIFAFFALYSPHLLGDKPDTGNLIGFIYKADRTSPYEKAIVQLINITTGSVYESTKSDYFGTFRIDGVEKGLYIAGIKTENGNFGVRNVIGVRANETSKVSFAFEKDEGNSEALGGVRVLTCSGGYFWNYNFFNNWYKDLTEKWFGDHWGDGDDDDDDDEDCPSPKKPKKRKRRGK